MMDKVSAKRQYDGLTERADDLEIQAAQLQESIDLLYEQAGEIEQRFAEEFGCSCYLLGIPCKGHKGKK